MKLKPDRCSFWVRMNTVMPRWRQCKRRAIGFGQAMCRQHTLLVRKNDGKYKI